jgi:hypothetical protein
MNARKGFMLEGRRPSGVRVQLVAGVKLGGMDPAVSLSGGREATFRGSA